MFFAHGQLSLKWLFFENFFFDSNVFSVVWWFQAFYKSNLACFFVSCFSDGEEITREHVPAGAQQYVGRITAEMVGETSVVVLWVCHWYIFVDSIFLFLNPGKHVSSHCIVSLSWENLRKGCICTGCLSRKIPCWLSCR